MMAAMGAAPIAGAAAGAPDTAAGPPAASEKLQELRQDTRRAHDAGDMALYVDDSRLLLAFLNGSPRGLLQLMSAAAAAGREADALNSFEEFVRMGQSDEATLSAKQFDAIRSTERYRAIHAAMAVNDGSIAAAAEFFKFDEGPLIPEDIDFDSAAHRFYVTSLLKKQVLSMDMSGHAKVFAKAPDGWPMMAVKVDSRRRLLWATEVALDGYIFSSPADWGRSAVVIYDLDTGKLLQRVEGPPHAAFGDMTLTAAGDAIVADGDQGGVYRVGRVTRNIERLDDGAFISPQTPVALADGRHLLVPDYLRGIGLLDLQSKQVTWLSTQGSYALSGIDGLYVFRDTLLATQNGTSPERVIRFAMDASLTRIEGESIIERSTATLGDPTHGVVVGDRFYYIANSGWDSLDEHGNVQAGKTLPRALVMRAELGKR
jgi:hypothetical protein